MDCYPKENINAFNPINYVNIFPSLKIRKEKLVDSTGSENLGESGRRQ